MAGHPFPAPIGGTPLPDVDFAPSILFAILYALLIPLMVYRAFHRRSRTILLLGTIAFAVERIVIFALRAVQSRRESSRLSGGLATYMQVSFAVGFVSRGSDLVNLLICLLVNPTYGPETYGQSPAAQTKMDGDTTFGVPSPDTPDQPKFRFWSRRFCDIMGLVFLVPLVLGVIANSQYKGAIEKADQAKKTQDLREISVVVGLVFFLVVLFATLWCKWKQPRASKRGTIILSASCLLMIVISIYRLGVMGETVTSLDGPSNLNTTSAKALFYVFHVLPEYLFSLLTFAVNIRKIFGTGPWGDWRGNDETDKEKAKREEKERAKAAKRAASRGAEQALS
ncbi:hypothetical protein CVT24_009666 [Panaeolus cyanescens]|uniref:Uncharacterized protein n=1 Tax=Panaeolus cyanescens TaxID=181874 RepID=A0A409Y9Z1_9AGAR|nr:hypothetical protein CVT24_009666 [Panaeolus cyanescens]